MENLLLEYPKCSTCQKARKWLETNGVEFKKRNIVENNPNEDELTDWIERSGIEIKRFFNTSGNKYKELNLKEKMATMSDEEKIKLLSTDGMLVKRPLLISEKGILVGFKEENWKMLLKK